MGQRPSKNAITGQFTSSHRGHDFSGKGDDGVYAYDSGEIIISKNKYATHWIQGDSNDPTPWGLTTEDYGNFIKLKHDDGTFSLSAHLKQNTGLSINTRVVKGQRIATIGNTGNSTGTHLHFEVRNTSDKTVEPVYEEITTMPTNDLARVLEYYKVKTSDELIHMVDEQLTFLESARKNNVELKAEYDAFILQIVEKLNPLKPLPAITDKNYALTLIEELVKQESQLQGQLIQKEKEWALKEIELKEENNRLTLWAEEMQKDLTQFKTDVVNHGKEIELAKEVRSFLDFFKNLFGRKQ